MSYDAKTFRQKSIFCTTPDGKDAPYDTPDPNNIGIQGGIWQSGQGIASDGDAIYFTTGNGGGKDTAQGNVHSYNANVGGNNYGNSVMKLGLDLKVRSFFTPSDQWTLDDQDSDFASGGVMVLPLQLGTHPNQIVTLGKDGTIFLLDRDGLGGFAGDSIHSQYGTNPYAIFTIGVQGEILPTNVVPPSDSGPGVWGGPAYYNGAQGQTIFYGQNGGPLAAFNLLAGVLTRKGTSSLTYGNFGTTPAVSSNNQTTNSQLVWAIKRDSGGNTSLTVYDAIALSNGTTKLPPVNNLNLTIGPWTEGRAFVVPTIVNGKVYAACQDHVGVFYCANETKVY
jgi:hypothetical protein